MEATQDELELAEDFPDFAEEVQASSARKRPLSAVWQFFERGVKDSHNKYSAACLTPGCSFRVTQGKVPKLEAHVLVGCAKMSPEERHLSKHTERKSKRLLGGRP
jgi:hypothetical protein